MLKHSVGNGCLLLLPTTRTDWNLTLKDGAPLQELLQQLVGGNSGVLVPAGQNMIGDSCFYQLDEKFVNNLVSLWPPCCACCLQ